MPWNCCSCTTGALASILEKQAQTVWFIDSVNGNDANDGLTAPTAIRTAAELIKRVNGPGIPWFLGADTSLTLLNNLPASDPLDLMLWQRQGGMLRIKGTPTASAGFVVGAVTALNRGANTAYDFTCVALGAGQVNKRIRITAGARLGYLQFLGKDMGGGQYRIAPLTFYNTTAASPGSVPTSQGAITGGDAFVVDTLTTIGLMHIRLVASDNLSAPNLNTVPIIFTDIQYTGGFNGGVIMSGYPDPTNTPIFYGCDIGSALFYGALIAGRQAGTTYASASAGPVQYFGSLISGNLSLQAGVMAFLDYDTLVQGGFLRFREGGTGRIGALGVFDSASDGVIVEDGSLRSLVFASGVDALYGAGNAGVGVNRAAGGPAYTYVAKPTLTGGVNDARVGGTLKAWGAIPFIEPANDAAIVAFA